MKTKRTKVAKPRAQKSTASEKSFVAAFERENAVELRAKLAKARESVAKGRTRKWDLDRFLVEAEKRRKSKLAAE